METNEDSDGKFTFFSFHEHREGKKYTANLQ